MGPKDTEDSKKIYTLSFSFNHRCHRKYKLQKFFTIILHNSTNFRQSGWPQFLRYFQTVIYATFLRSVSIHLHIYIFDLNFFRNFENCYFFKKKFFSSISLILVSIERRKPVGPLKHASCPEMMISWELWAKEEKKKN